MRQLLSLLPKPSHYIGTEEGSIHKEATSVRLRVGLAFPDMYTIGMSYLGQKILYGRVNEHEAWWAERVFAPSLEAAVILREHKAPLCTLESDTPLTELDVLGFSLTHELCYTLVLYMLDLAGIPLRAEERKQSHQPDGRPWPLIIAGGGATLAAEPLAPFIDVMQLGEGEEMLPELLAVVDNCKQQDVGREAMLQALRRISGVYIPEFFRVAQNDASYLEPLYPDYTVVTRRVIADFDTAYYPERQVLPFGAVHNRLSLEIARGCTRGCRFCQAGIIYRPARERSVDSLEVLTARCLATSGYEDISFLSLSCGDFSALKTLFLRSTDRCAAEQISVSLPSLRVGSIDDSIMERMAGIRRTGATLAPEAGSQRLRDVINKGITEEELITHVQKLFEHGWQQIKLYFMIGLPTECDADILAILDLCRKVRDAAGPGVKRLQVTAAISPFVPKPHTPFQWEAQASYETIRERLGLLLTELKRERRITMRWHDPRVSLLEGIFSRGDRQLAPVLEAAYRNGAVFMDRFDLFPIERWLEILQEHGIDHTRYTGAWAVDAPLPWDHLQSGVSKAFLLREREHSFVGKVTDDCRYSSCRECGVCDTKAAPSLLDALANGQSYSNRLNFPQRDQTAHRASFDGAGRVVVRGQEDAAQAHEPQEEEQTQLGKKKKPLPPDHGLGAKIRHYRVWYAKKDAAVYLSQLELQSLFERALRRGKVPISFSRGFHPLPVLSFGRALPVGVASHCEWFSIHLRESLSASQLREALTPYFPKGMTITGIDALLVNQRPLDSAQDSYHLEYRPNNPETALPWAAFVTLWDTVAAAESISWTRETKKGPRTLDLRLLFQHISASEAPPHRISLVFDWSDKYVSPMAACQAALAFAGEDFAVSELFLTRCARAGA